MIIEALQPMKVKREGQVLILIPGSRLNLSSLQAEKLLAHAPGKIRVIAPFAVGDSIVYRVPGDPQEGPFEVIMVSPGHYQGGWWAVVLKPSEKEGAEPKPDTTEQAFIHQVLIERVIPKKSQTP